MQFSVIFRGSDIVQRCQTCVYKSEKAVPGAMEEDSDEEDGEAMHPEDQDKDVELAMEDEGDEWEM